jgi:hypothetical protein
MVDSFFKFLLKEKDLKEVLNLSPSQDFFLIPNLNTSAYESSVSKQGKTFIFY